MKHRLKEAFYIFFKSFLIAFIMIIPFILINDGVLKINTDFQFQQIPFGYQTNLAIKEGNVFWEPLNELGSSFIGSYSFYTLGSPFYWLSLLFPAHWYPYLIGILLMVKFGVASLTAYYYIKSFVKCPKITLWASWLYAFSGFQLSNMLFNHFHDITALFPLLLIALDHAFLKQKKGWFGLAVALLALVNYYFFVIEVIFLILYTIVNLITGRYHLTKPLFFQLAFESLVGVGMACILFLPSILFILGNPRSEETLFELVQYDFALFNVLFLLELPRRILQVPEAMSFYSWNYSFNYTSSSLWIPLIGPSFTLAWIEVLQLKKWRWLKYLIILFIICFLCPYIGSIFILFKDFNYRWAFPFLLLVALLSGVVLESFTEKMQKSAAKISAYGFFAIILVNIPTLFLQQGDTWLPFATQLILSLGQSLAMFIILKQPRLTLQKFKQLLIPLTIISIIINGWNILYLSGLRFPESFEAYDYSKHDSIKNYLSQETNMRLDTNQIFLNRHYTFQTPATTGFNSTIQGGLFDIYANWLLFNRYVATCTNENDSHYFQTAMSVKYVITYKEGVSDYYLENYKKTSHCFEEEIISYPNLVKVMEDDHYILYENKDFIPMGFTYDYYLTTTEMNEKVGLSHRSPYLLKTLVLTPEQATVYDSWLEPYPDEGTTYEEDIIERNKETCSTFYYTQTGAYCKIKLEHPNMVFFSIPFSKGWKAIVNGETASIEEVSGGFIGVPIDSDGEFSIDLIYHPEGLQLGVIITGLSSVLMAGYLILNYCPYGKKRR